MQHKDFIEKLKSGELLRAVIVGKKAVFLPVKVEQGYHIPGPASKLDTAGLNKQTTEWGCAEPKEHNVWWVNMYSKEGDVAWSIPLARFNGQEIKSKFTGVFCEREDMESQVWIDEWFDKPKEA